MAQDAGKQAQRRFEGRLPRAQKALESFYDSRFDKEGGAKAIKTAYNKANDDVKTVHAGMLERLTCRFP